MMAIAGRAAVPTLIAALLSTTALAAVPDNAGVLLAVAPGGMSAPVVEQLEGATLRGRSFSATDGRVVDLTMSDGTAIRLAPGSRLTIEDYSFDEASHARAFVVRVDTGTVRIIGSDRNGFDPIRVHTPAGSGELQGGGVIEVGADGVTTTSLLFGDSFTFTANGDTTELYRPGFEVRTAPDENSDQAQRGEAGGLEQVAFALNPGLARAAEAAPEEGPIPGAGPTGQTPTQSFANLVEVEEDRAEAEQEGATEDAARETRPTQPTQPTQPPTAALPGAGVIGGSLGAGSSFGPSGGLVSANLSGDVASSSAAPQVTLSQTDGPKGSTSQIIFSGVEKSTQSLARAETRPTRVIVSKDGNLVMADLEYQFVEAADLPTLGALALDDETLFPDDDINLTIQALFLLGSQAFFDPELNQTTFELSSDGESLQSRSASFFGNASPFTVAEDPETEAPIHAESVMIGFRPRTMTDEGTAQVVAENEHFLAIEISPALATEQGRRDVAKAHTSGDIGGQDPDEQLLSFFGIQASPDQSAQNIAFALRGALLSSDAVEAIGRIDQLTADQKASATAELLRTDRLIFATGDVLNPQEVSGSNVSERGLIRYFLAPDLSTPDDEQRVAEGIRAFLRNATAFRADAGGGGLELADTGLLVIGVPKNSVQSRLGTPDNGSPEQTAAIHIDFGIEGLGDQSKLQQSSTISATIGEVAYGVDEGIPGLGDDEADDEVVLRGLTIGSSQKPGTGSVLMVGDVFNTAAGGGGTVNGQPLPGRATHLVIENFDPDHPDTTGGKELPVGGAAAGEGFAFLRLATAVESTQKEAVAGPATEFKGFAAGLGEVASAGANAVAVGALTTGETEEGFSLAFSPSDNRIGASLTLIDQATKESHGLALGGLTGTESRGASAFIDSEQFGARTLGGAGADVAMVSGGLVTAGLNNLGPTEAADTREVLSKLASVDVPDLKWGFFFGDVVNGGENRDGLRKHVHMGSWVAGRIADPSRLPNSGTATYNGHAAGNVINGGSLYTQVGNYTNSWNFGSRSGATTLDFDGARMIGETTAENGSVRFNGPLAGNGRNASIAGAFVSGNETGIAPPAGQIGNFAVTGDNYGAAGVFAAKGN